MVMMRGHDTHQSSMLCLMSPADCVPSDHPLRTLKHLADEALRALSGEFDAMYSESGRLETAFDASTFSHNRQRLLGHAVGPRFFAAVVAVAQRGGLMSSEHFSVDGTLIESWASMKSFRPKDDGCSDTNGWGDFRGTRRSNDTHESKTDPEARLMRKGRGREARLSYSGHALMENRNGLLMDIRVEEANGYAEREAALQMLESTAPGSRRATVAADRGYDTRDFIAACRRLAVTPHVVQHRNARRSSAIDRRTTRHRGYAISLVIRRRIEQVFGWLKTIGGLRRTRYRGRQRTQLWAYIAGAAYNLLRVTKLTAAHT